MYVIKDILIWTNVVLNSVLINVVLNSVLINVVLNSVLINVVLNSVLINVVLINGVLINVVLITTVPGGFSPWLELSVPMSLSSRASDFHLFSTSLANQPVPSHSAPLLPPQPPH